MARSPAATKDTSESRSAVRSARIAVSAAFALNGAFFGAWASRVPAVKSAFGFSEGELGLVLLALAGGAIASFPVAGLLSERLGAAVLSRQLTMLYIVSFVVLGAAALSGLTLPLVIALLLFGAAFGSLDVAMNGWAAEVEQAADRPLMSGFHALFSVGAGAGAGSGFVASHLELGVAMHFWIAAVLLGALALALILRAGTWPGSVRVARGEREPAEEAGRRESDPRDRGAGVAGAEDGDAGAAVGATLGAAVSVSREAAPGEDPAAAAHVAGSTSDAQISPESTPLLALPRGALLLAGLIGLGTALGEGALADWSAVYLVLVTGAETPVAALGYASFSVTMVALRLTGDRIVQWLGPVHTVRASAAVAVCGIVLVVGVPETGWVLAGFALMGAGYAIVMPLVFSRAAADPLVAPGIAIAGVATLAYGGMLLGPPAIGGLAELFGLRPAFSMLGLLALMAFLLARHVQVTPERSR